MTIYENNLEHLLEELRRIDLVVSLNLEKRRPEHSKGAEDFLGLYISEEEVDTILQTPLFERTSDAHPDIEFKNKLAELDDLKKNINAKKEESLREGKELRLQKLAGFFDLQPFEVDALLFCLAPELDLRYEKLYSYMQNDVTKKRPTVDLVIKLLFSSIEERFKAREFFSQDASLIKNRLVYLTGDGPEDLVPLLSRSIKVDDRIISYLLGTNKIDRRLLDFSSIIKPERSFNDLILDGDIKNMLTDLINERSGLNGPLIFFYHGPYGTGKKMTAEAVCRELGMPLLMIDSKVLLKGEPLETLKIILREAVLQESSIYLEGIDSVWKEKDGIDGTNMVKELDRFPNWIFLSGELLREPSGIFQNHGFMSIPFPLPSFTLRKTLWDHFLDGNMSEDIDIEALSNKFKLSGGQIRDAMFRAQSIAMTKRPGACMLSLDDLYDACKALSNRNLTTFARKIEPRYKWEDIALPRDTKEQLKEVSEYIIYRGTVYTDWGFDRKLSIGKGLNVLFSGPSGTGKTMAAEIIAKEAGLDIYKIDLSGVVSKYIGETEKNLKNIFKEAETSNAVLFFDEADALFGKRSEVRDSHDRYANIEIDYLLQKMEEYEGIVILASNFRKNIDDAFLRRMHFKIDFLFPDEKMREMIWRGIFPEETPIGDDVDYSYLVKFKIAGGSIKNIALSAAFLAAGNSRKVKMEHIIRATKREFQKIGKLCVKEDFGKYYEIIEEGMKDE